MSDAEEPTKERPDGSAWREAYVRGLSTGSATCPAEGELAALVLGEVSGDERVRLADHLVACRRCAGAYRALLELHDAASAEPAEAATRRPQRSRRLVGWAAAAALVVAGVFLVQQRIGDGGPVVVRGNGEAARLLDPPAGARLREPPRRLAWTATEAGAVYRVVVYDAESTPLWRSDPTSEPELVLPASVRERLARGGTFYWRVRVEGESGRSATPLQRFTVSR